MFAHAGDGKVSFHEASERTSDHTRQLKPILQRRVLRYFGRHGLLDAIDPGSMLTWQGAGGFSVDASVRIEAHDRAGIERDHLPTAGGAPAIVPRPPFALERLHALGSTAALDSPDTGSSTDSPNPTSVDVNRN